MRIPETIKRVARRIPGVLHVYRFLLRLQRRRRLRRKGAEEIFTDIFRVNRWGGKDSVSGPGSGAGQVRAVTKDLPILLRDLGISTILDIPCGDFHWMKDVNLDGVRYIGADVVEELVMNNKANHETVDLRFLHLNLLTDELPKADLVFCRDCLVHFSYHDIILALRNIYASQPKYILTTTFPSRRSNRDILTGEWRPLNLEIPPFNFSEPLRILGEHCTEGNGAYQDKSLGLWPIEEIKKIL